jgi:hypothetical protein
MKRHKKIIDGILDCPQPWAGNILIDNHTFFVAFEYAAERRSHRLSAQNFLPSYLTGLSLGRKPRTHPSPRGRHSTWPALNRLLLYKSTDLHIIHAASNLTTLITPYSDTGALNVALGEAPALKTLVLSEVKASGVIPALFHPSVTRVSLDGKDAIGVLLASHFPSIEDLRLLNYDLSAANTLTTSIASRQGVLQNLEMMPALPALAGLASDVHLGTSPTPWLTTDECICGLWTSE